MTKRTTALLQSDDSRSCLRSLMRFLSVIWLLVTSTVISSSMGQLTTDDGQHWLRHPRASSLCANDFDGYEGTQIKGFTLDHVLSVTTPGFTFRPTEFLSPGSSNSHCHFHDFAYSHPSEKARDYIQALWMKDRMFEKKSRPGSAFKVFESVPQAKKCKENMLTPEGIIQSIRLGEYLAKSYHKTLPVLSSLSRQLWKLAHSVGDEVLYQSIYAVLYGLLGEKQFVYSGVGKLPYHFAAGKSPNDEDTHEQLSYFIKKSFKDEHHLFKDNSSPTSDKATIDSEFGMGISAKDILSSLSRKDCVKHWREDSPSFTKDLIDSVLSVSDAHNGYLMNSSFFQNYSKVITLQLRQFIKSWIMFPHNAEDVDFKLISIDELSLLSLLAVLDLNCVGHIPPASRLVVERFHMKKSHPRSGLLSPVMSILDNTANDSSFSKGRPDKYARVNNGKLGSSTLHSQKTYIRVLYNGRVVTNNVLNCKSDPYFRLGLCSLSSFVQTLELDFLNENFIHRTKDEF